MAIITEFDDVIRGGAQNDVFFGLGGNDIVRGFAGNDELNGGEGNDVLVGQGGKDLLVGGNGDDVLNGGNGDDILFGEAGKDTLRGGSGRDWLDGGTDIDTLNGGNGDDIIKGGDDIVSDQLTGGQGADSFVFAFDALATGDTNPATRQVTGGEDFLKDFDHDSDTVLFDASAFGIEGPLSFASGFAADLPVGGANVIVLRDTDNDGNPATAFNAGTAANLIAAKVEVSGAGFFVYWNSGLGVNRLVYSEDLSDPTADLQILGRFTDAVGANAIAELSLFAADNFAFLEEVIAPTDTGIGLLAL